MSLLWITLAKQVPLWVGSVKEVLGQLGLSSLAKDLDQIFFSNLSESEFFNGFCILSSFLVI